ncbi:uncharacterized protein LOC115806441 [Chanos chanos]|uniref:Uncharacterized protein LOC115806441 n=1 Tax=Chanos chanos TaxID=29144 RepID=A0A6J2UT83_CHACN|nr:uncharacterized protein LOC115806441 [Chanos chanos]
MAECGYEFTTMGDHNIARLTLIIIFVLGFVVTMVFNVLAGPGVAPFEQTTSNVSAKYDTEITPSGWTFSIWGVIYTWLAVMLIYIVANIFRRNAYGRMYCSPPVLPYGFFFTWIFNFVANIAWLLLWDREEMVASFIFLALIAFSNYAIIFFACQGLNAYGAWLNKYHKVDLWCMRILVLNGIAVYTTWTSIATLLNLAIVTDYEAGMSRSDAATLSLSLLLAEVVVWFILENFVIEKHVRYILTIYPVIIVALSGNMTKNYDAASPSRNGIFIAVLLALACLLFAIRICLVVWRHKKRPLYEGPDGEEVMSPMAIAEKRKKILK